MATTVGVAWRDAMRPPRLVRGIIDLDIIAMNTRDHLYVFTTGSEFLSRKGVRTVWMHVSMHTATSHPWNAAPMNEFPARLHDAINEALDKPPAWTFFPEPPDEPSTFRSTHTTAAGRPFPALRSYSMTTEETGAPMRVESFWQIDLGTRGSLPLQPIFPGFLFSSLLYAAPWWLLLLTPGAVKRWRRRRRGRCIGCGYDLTGLVAENGARTCPECGRIERHIAPV